MRFESFFGVPDFGSLTREEAERNAESNILEFVPMIQQPFAERAFRAPRYSPVEGIIIVNPAC